MFDNHNHNRNPNMFVSAQHSNPSQTVPQTESQTTDSSATKQTSIRQTWSEYMASKRKKLVEQFNEEVSRYNSEHCSQLDCDSVKGLFSGVCIYVNGYTKPTALELKQMMKEYGGEYLNYFDATKTTHTIASNLPFAKLKHLRGNQKIVDPNWIVDSIQHKRLLPINDYLICKVSGDIERFLLNSKTIDSESSIQVSDNCVATVSINDSSHDVLIDDRNTDNKELNTANIAVNDQNGHHFNDTNGKHFIRGNQLESENNNQINDTNDCKQVKTTVCELVVDDSDNETDKSTKSSNYDQKCFMPQFLSQLDKKSLNCLPKSIRDEILSSFSSNKSDNPTKKSSHTSPKKNGKKNGLNRKKKSKTTDFKKAKHLKSGPLDKIFNDIKSYKLGGLLSSNTSANVCGKIETQHVIDLIEEWIATEEDLIDEDVAYITKYFYDLIDEKEFDKLMIIASAFYEAVSQRNQNEWKAMFNDIRNIVLNELIRVNNEFSAHFTAGVLLFEL